MAKRRAGGATRQRKLDACQLREAHPLRVAVTGSADEIGPEARVPVEARLQVMARPARDPTQIAKT